MYNHKSGISLRKIEQKDLNFLLEVKNNSWIGTHNTLISNNEDQIIWYNNIPNNDLYMIAYKDNQLFGFCSYTQQNHISKICQISGSLSKIASQEKQTDSCWYCGIDFAFEILNMHKVEAEVLSYNIPAQKMNIDKIHMRIEGVKRQSVFKSGKYYDSIILGLLKSEWEQDERVKSYNGSCNLTINHFTNEKLEKRSKHYENFNTSNLLQ